MNEKPESGLNSGAAQQYIKPPYRLKRFDEIFAYIFLALGALYPFLYMGYDTFVSRTVWLVLFLAVGLLYFSLSKKRLTAPGLLLTVALFCFAAVFTINSYYIVTELCGFVVSLLIPLWLTSLAGTSVGGRHIFSDYLNGAFVRPFSNLGAIQGVVRQKKTLSVAIGVLLAVPVVVIAGSLLSADAAFGGVLRSIFKQKDIFSYVIDLFKLIFGVLVGIYLFSAAYGARCERVFGITENRAKSAAERARFIPRSTAIVTLSLISAVYILYLISQAAYFFSAFGSILPAGYGYAEYARSGFFELCSVCFINAVVILVAKTLVKNGESRMIKGFVLGISGFSLLLGLTVIAKLAMYMRSYGLTVMRLVATLFTLIMITAFVAIIVGTIINKGVLRAIAASAAILVLAFAAADPEYQIARFNIKMYESGSHSELDIDYLVSSLKGSSYRITLPYIKNNKELNVEYYNRLKEYYENNSPSAKRWSVGTALERRALADYLENNNCHN